MQRIRSYLIRQAGGYLRSPVREPGITCEVCCTPVEGSYSLCRPCYLHAAEFGSGLADLVVPLTYATSGQQSGHLMRQYKDSPFADVRDEFSNIVAGTLLYGLLKHEICMAHVAGQPVTARMSVPSLSRRRGGPHPLAELARRIKATSLAGARLVPTLSPTADRTPSDQRFAVEPVGAAQGRHIVVLDDTWASGSHAQSAALTLKAAGAQWVTVVPISRWLNPDFPGTRAFVNSRLTADYEPDRCPVSGANCPG